VRFQLGHRSSTFFCSDVNRLAQTKPGIYLHRPAPSRGTDKFREKKRRQTSHVRETTGRSASVASLPGSSGWQPARDVTSESMSRSCGGPPFARTARPSTHPPGLS
jgi:hypothetical protein